MAASYAALTSLMHVLEQIQHHPCPPITLGNQQMESLQEHVSFLQDFLENYSHGKDCSAEESLLESQIARAAYAAEDIIESHVVDQILSGSTTSGRQTIHNNLFSQALQKVIDDDMDLIRKQVIRIQEKGTKYQESINSISTVLSASPLTGYRNNTMVGFDDVLMEIMDTLTAPQPDGQILTIVGMGGIGKTTLARNVYNNLSVVQHFDVRAWVNISQECRVREIILGALFCVRKSERDENLEEFSTRFSQMREDELGHLLYKRLSGRRYLIIMDDMWSIEAWEKLKFFFPDFCKGSRMLITTRLSNVANHFGSCSFKLNFLDEDGSWDLLCKNTFTEQRCPVELEEAGKEIARNCKGLPLSIVVIGGLLANSEKTQEHWKKVAENLNSIVNLENDEHCLNILSLSYNHLPVHLKPCFLYMGVFPEDSEIRVSWLKQLWVAEGFLKPIKDKSLEVVAEEYLKDLIDRNLILVRKWGSTGKVKFCNIHDVLRDLCLREAGKEKFLWFTSRMHDFEIRDDIRSQRRISFHQSTLREERDTIYQVLHALPSASLARSLICDFNGVLPSLTKFRLLRVFKVVDKYLYDEEKRQYCYSLKDIFQLVNSRYLAFRGDWDSSFISNIHLLWNLQILIVKVSWGWRTSAPPEIWKMSQLKHLEFGGLLLSYPSNIPIQERDNFTLKNLQRVFGIRNFKLSEEMAKRIPNIKKLQVYYDSPETWSYNFRLNYRGCTKLESLDCIFPSEENPNLGIELLKNLAFPHSLKKLSLRGSCLLWEDMTMIGSLPHLEVLKLKADSFKGPEWNPIEGEFLRLKVLEIKWCVDLVNWTADNTHFPCLEHLVLCSLFKLQEIPLDIGTVPTLQSIKLINCSESVLLSANNILEEQENLGNMGLQVRVISWGDIELERSMGCQF